MCRDLAVQKFAFVAALAVQQVFPGCRQSGWPDNKQVDC